MESIFSFAKTAQMCSPTSQYLLFSIIFSSLMISVGGIYVWRKYIRTQPGVVATDKKELISLDDGDKLSLV